LSECFLPLSLCRKFQVVVRSEPEAGEEFVPEPGTMLLQGSGLGGYGSLRRRARQ
jgi:hypothetical protein